MNSAEHGTMSVSTEACSLLLREQHRRDPTDELISRFRDIQMDMASPFVAVVLSFFIPGLGQFYTGQLIKAIVLFVAAVIFGALSTILIGIPFYLIVWLYSMYDAYTVASKSD